MTALMLGIDTATALTTVALTEPDVTRGTLRVLAERQHRDPRRHGEVLPVLIDELLSQASRPPRELTAIAVGVGPGAYTGLRVGIATAQAMASTLQIPAFGALTLDAIAFATARTESFAIVTDARRSELFAARYGDYRSREAQPWVAAPEAVASELNGVAVFAPAGTPKLPGADYQACAEVSATDVCRVVVDRQQRGEPLEPVRPMYLRRPDVSTASAPKSVL